VQLVLYMSFRFIKMWVSITPGEKVQISRLKHVGVNWNASCYFGETLSVVEVLVHE